MAEQKLEELFVDLDTDVRRLLSLIHDIKINKILQNKKLVSKQIEEAIFLSQKITAELYSILGDSGV